MAELKPVHFTAANVDISLTPPGSPQSIGLALLNNKPIPDDAFTEEAIPLGSIKAAASKDIKLDKVEFSAGGSAFAGFGVYRSTSKLFDALKAEGLDEPMIGRLDFPDLDKKNLFALRWGYGAQGSVGGKVALGPSISFGASGRLEGLYALLHLVDRNANALDSIIDTVNSWKMPRQVATPGDLKPGTWVISETDGEIQLTLGVEYGYNYNWVRESLALGGLSGDIGLKIEMGVKAQLGFNASGRYALVLARESESEALRLQVFKLRSQGWTFAFDASVSAQVTQDLIPDNFDDFVKGVFNVNAHQAVADILKEFDKWTDPNKKLKDLLGAELVDYAKKMVKEVTGIDPDTDIDKAIERLRKPLEQWRALPHEVTSVLYDLLRKETPVEDLQGFLRKVVELTDPKKLADEIAGRLREVAFFETASGKWLTAAARQGILSLVARVPEERERLADIAQKTLNILDGSTAEDTLRKLQAWIEEKLGLDKILAVADQASFDKMDAWLKKRLSEFLGKSVVFGELDKVKAAINSLRDRAREFYAKGFAALIEKYQAEFHYSFQKTTTRTALIDITFDFGADATNARKLLEQTMGGNFKEVLAKQLPGVKLNMGVLTHEIKRRTHIEVNLPYFKSTLDHINESLAGGEAVDSKDGRLWIFNLKAFDVVSKKQSISKLSVAIQFTKKMGLRQFSAEDFRYDYTLRLTKRDAEREYLLNKLQVLVDQYLPSEFSGDGKKPFATYLTALDKALDDKGVGGDDSFGNLLIGFDVSLPGDVLAAWKKVPAEKKAPAYMAMSRRVQEVLRRFIPICYIRDVDQYKETDVIYPLLVYCALPPINTAKLSRGLVRLTEEAVHDWEFQESDLRNAVFEQFCGLKLKNEILPQVRKELHKVPDSQSLYTDSQIGRMLSLRPVQVKQRFESLMFTEGALITKIHEAGQRLRKHLDSREPEEAVEALAKFGASLTDAFNNKVGDTIYGGATLRPLGSLLFIEVAKIFDEKLTSKIEASVMLELIALPGDSAFALDGYLHGERPESAGIALQQRIVKVGTPSL
jgi:hypothetical protein